METWIVAFLIIAVCYSIYNLYNGLTKGEIAYKYRTISRKDSPVVFWIAFSFLSAVTLILAAILAFNFMGIIS